VVHVHLICTTSKLHLHSGWILRYPPPFTKCSSRAWSSCTAVQFVQRRSSHIRIWFLSTRSRKSVFNLSPTMDTSTAGGSVWPVNTACSQSISPGSKQRQRLGQAASTPGSARNRTAANPNTMAILVWVKFTSNVRIFWSWCLRAAMFSSD